MTEFEVKVLERLTYAWMRPKDFGAARSTYHAKVATRAVANGWVERRQEIGAKAGPRGHYLYRITEKGERALENHHLTRGRLSDLVGAVGAVGAVGEPVNGGLKVVEPEGHEPV